MRYLKLIFSTIIFIFSYSAYAETEIDLSNLDAPVPMDKTIRKGTLENGLTYYIKKNAKPEKRMELRLAIKAGAINEDSDQNGVAHFVEHMLFNGTENFPKNELVHYLEKIGVRFGADLNAYTDINQTVYQLPIPTDKPELIADGFKILADWAGHATFKPEEIDKERGVVLEEWRLKQGAGMRASKTHRPTIYYGSKLATHDVIGDAEVIKKSSYDVIKRFYQDWYRPDLMAVIAIGDFDVNQIEKKIKDNFSNLKNPDNPRQLTGDDIEIKSNQEPLVSIYTDSEQTSTIASISYKKPAEKQGSFQQSQNSFIHTMESSIFSERIDEILQKNPPPFQMAGISYTNMFSNVDIFTTYTVPKTEDFMTGYKMALTEFFRAIQQGFTEGEYNRAKSNLLSYLEASYNNRDKIESNNYADEYIRNFIFNESIPGIEYEYPLYKKFSQNIKVEDINNALKTQVTLDNMMIKVTGVKKSGITIPSKEALLATYKELQNTKFEFYQDKFSDKNLFSKELKSGTISKTTEIKEIGMTEFILSNGIKVLVKPTSFNDSEILFQAFSKGGNSLVPEIDYLNGEYAASIINSSGISDFNNITLQKLLAGKYVSISSYINDVSEGFNGLTSPKDTEILLQLLHLFFTNPHKDKEDFNAFITKNKQWIEDYKRNPTTEFSEIIYYIMSGNDPRSKPITKEMIENLNLDKAYTIYQQRFSDASDFTFVFVGAIDMDKFKGFLTKYLASLPTHGVVENFKDIFHDTPKQSIKKDFYKGKEDKSNVVLKMNGDFDYNRKNIYITQALSQILNYRLTDKLREEKAEVYSPQGYIGIYHYPKSEYVAEIGLSCKPSNVKNLIQSVKEIVQNLQTKLPTNDDMKKVKESDNRQYEVNLKKNDYWMGKIVSSYYNNLEVKDIVNYPDLINSLTKEDIKKAANKYFKLDGLKEFVLYPELKK